MSEKTPLWQDEDRQGDAMFIYSDVSLFFSGASKHVDFSLALTKLAHGAHGVNELVLDVGWAVGGQICRLLLGMERCTFLSSRGGELAKRKL